MSKLHKYFLSSRNVNDQCARLIKILGIRNNPDLARKCKKFLAKQMGTTYREHGHKKGNKSAMEFISRLNDYSVKKCAKIYMANRKKQSRQKKQPWNIDDLKRGREEIHGLSLRLLSS